MFFQIFLPLMYHSFNSDLYISNYLESKENLLLHEEDLNRKTSVLGLMLTGFGGWISAAYVASVSENSWQGKIPAFFITGLSCIPLYFSVRLDNRLDREKHLEKKKMEMLKEGKLLPLEQVTKDMEGQYSVKMIRDWEREVREKVDQPLNADRRYGYFRLRYGVVEIDDTIYVNKEELSDYLSEVRKEARAKRYGELDLRKVDSVISFYKELEEGIDEKRINRKKKVLMKNEELEEIINKLSKKHSLDFRFSKGEENV